MAESSNTILSEDEFVVQLQARSNEAFARLYDDYGAAMLGIINKFVSHPDEAENLLQDVFVKVWRHIHRYDSTKGRLFTWLITICRNTALNYLRSRENFLKIEIQTGDTGVSTQRLIAEPIPVDHIGIRKMVDRLDAKHRDVINLIYYWGYTQQEVAEKLDIPLGTVKTRTRMALQVLKEQLNN